MKRVWMGIVICLIVISNFALAQENLRGTEEPAAYGSEKQKILQRQERMQRSQTIQDVAQTYREMVSSYKAKRIVYAEEMSQKLDELLDDPILPEAFANKMKNKQQSFLKRIYGDEHYVKIDIPVDDISDAEVAEIQQVAEEEVGRIPVSVQKNINQELDTKEVKSNIVSDKEKIRQDRKQELDRRREERANLRRVRQEEKAALKEEKIALQKKRALDDAVLKELNKAKKYTQKEKNIIEKKSLEEQSLEQQPLEVVEKFDREQRQAEELYVYQQQLLEMERSEIDRYVDLYKKDREKQKKELQEEFSKKIELLYQEGASLLEKKAYRFSYDILKEVEKLKPDYKLTRRYLTELEMYFKFDSEKTSVYLENDSKRQQLIAESLSMY